ncbi:polysaccharide biosynthesis tyrosine autokinase [uncultured Vibrio sp.]|uniref:GumC family protein n=1 Tax=uncultured Vibrio sp. TaxID=114054 RepID=UPI0029C9519F|nr:polysaccharide biosynthesis tyrosine autokinase [uncultured Vibrio sp.]
MFNNIPQFEQDTPWSKENQVSLRDYFAVIKRVWWKILLISVIATLLVAFVVSLIPPVYKANATLIFEPEMPRMLSIEQIYIPDSRNNDEFYKTQTEILKSRPIAEEVINKLGLVDVLSSNDSNKFSVGFLVESISGYLSDAREWVMRFFGVVASTAEVEMPVDPMNRAIEKYFENLEIAPVNNTQLVKIKFSSTVPKLAAAVVNTHADVYLESALDAKLSVTKSTEQWMTNRLSTLKGTLEQSEQELQAFREKEKLVDSDGLQHLPTLTLNELTTKLVETQQQLSLTKNAYSQVASWGGNASKTVNSIPSVPEILNDPLIQQLKSQLGIAKQKVRELSVRYRSLHPVMVAARENVKTIEDTLLSQATSVIQGIKTKYEATAANEKSIQEAIEATKNRYHELGRKASALDALKREVDANRELYALFLKRIKETTEMSFADSVNARVIVPAIVPYEPFKPQKALTISMTFAVSLFFGVFISFVRDSMDNRLTNIGDVELKLGYQLLGVVPMLETKQTKQQPALLLNKFSEDDAPERRFIEAMHSLRAGIILSEKPSKTIMVTSSLSSEGKSNLAMNLAYVCSLFERVVLVECDLCRPVVAKGLNIDSRTPGLVELVEGKACLEDGLVEHKNFHVIHAGSSRAQDSKVVIGSSEFKHLLESLASKYDRVILDCPPVLLVSDPEIISTYTDMVVYVVRTGSTQITQIKNGIEKLMRIKDQPIKVVANGFDDPFTSNYKYYSDYYGHSK